LRAIRAEVRWNTQDSREFHDQVIVEPGISGAIPFGERPEGSKLWADLHKGDTLVAAKLDRMFRPPATASRSSRRSRRAGSACSRSTSTAAPTTSPATASPGCS
jgi:DNA invertase Pin-like site-specific DNA recombinase